MVTRRDILRTASLGAAASLYAAYAAVFVEDPERAARLAGRSLDYAERGLCASRARQGCGLSMLAYEDLEGRLPEFGPRDVPALYTLSVSWLVYIRTHAEERRIRSGCNPAQSEDCAHAIVRDETVGREVRRCYAKACRKSGDARRTTDAQ